MLLDKAYQILDHASQYRTTGKDTRNFITNYHAADAEEGILWPELLH